MVAVVDHAPGILSMEAETITATISLIEGKRYTKAVDVGEVVVVEKGDRVGLEAIPPNRLTRIKPQVEISTKEVFNLNHINYPPSKPATEPRNPRRPNFQFNPNSRSRRSYRDGR